MEVNRDAKRGGVKEDVKGEVRRGGERGFQGNLEGELNSMEGEWNPRERWRGW